VHPVTSPNANIFQPLIDVFEQVLLFFHNTVGLSWGMSIIALTVAVRTVLLPLTIKQFKSMARLQQLAPEMKALQVKYKDDKQRLQQETMKFYRENQVNPLGSCLPLVLQIPVFIGLFYMLQEDLKIDICGPRKDIEAVGKLKDTGCEQVIPGSADFWFIPDLTVAATGGVLVTLLVLYVASQLVSSVLMSVTADKTQRTIMIALPFVFVFFVRTFPAGLLVYWITTNIWTIGQQLFVRKALDQPMPWVVRREAKEAKAEGRAPPSPWASREDRANGTGTSPTSVPKREIAPPPPPRRKKKKTGKRR